MQQDASALRKIVLDLAEQADLAFAEQPKYESLLRELLEAQRNRKSEQLSKEQLALFEGGLAGAESGRQILAGRGR